METKNTTNNNGAEKANNQSTATEECGVVCFVKKHTGSIICGSIAIGLAIGGYTLIKHCGPDVIIFEK
jgi:hypothetical protein